MPILPQLVVHNIVLFDGYFRYEALSHRLFWLSIRSQNTALVTRRVQSLGAPV